MPNERLLAVIEIKDLFPIALIWIAIIQALSEFRRDHHFEKKEGEKSD